MAASSKLLQQWKDNDVSYMLIECRCGTWFSKQGSLPRHVNTCGQCGIVAKQMVKQMWDKQDALYEASKKIKQEEKERMKIPTARHFVHWTPQ